jgi:hypothetical protein
LKLAHNDLRPNSTDQGEAAHLCPKDTRADVYVGRTAARMDLRPVRLTAIYMATANDRDDIGPSSGAIRPPSDATYPPAGQALLPRLSLITFCALLTCLLWAAQVNPYPNPFNDAARYLVLGTSVARTGDLRLLNAAHHPRDTLYPPGYPAIVAACIRMANGDPIRAVPYVKVVELLMLLACLPLLDLLLARAGLPFGYRAAGLLMTAACPALVAYANEVMSEIPMLFLGLASVALVERDVRAPDSRPGTAVRLISLAFACAAFLVRTAAAPLLAVQTLWFWRRFGRLWGLAALLASCAVAGGWQMRTARIIRHAPPGIHYSTYMEQFLLRDPSEPGAGRIAPNLSGLWERAKTGIPTYIGMISRSVFHKMARDEPGYAVFMTLAVALTLLTAIGLARGWQTGLRPSVAYWALFWLAAAMWPWRNARFLVPIVPLTLLFTVVGLRAVADRLRPHIGAPALRSPALAGALLLAAYCAYAHRYVYGEARPPVDFGYAYGRMPDEGGFYAACAWVRQRAEPGVTVAGRPPYLVYLFTGHPAVAIEPTLNARAQEIANMRRNHVRYLLQDAWVPANPSTDAYRYLSAYLTVYQDQWKPVFTDPRSGVRIWRRP